MFKTLKRYIIKIRYDGKHAGSGVIIKSNDSSNSFYIFTAKHIFFDKNMKITDMKVDNITKKVSIYNLFFDIEDDIELELFEIKDEYDFLIIKVSNCKIEEALPTNIFMDEMDNQTRLSIMGFPSIRDNKTTKYDSYSCTYKHPCDYIKHFEVDSDNILTLRDIHGNANIEISGLSGSGVYLTTDDKEVSIVGILIESATGQGIVCFDLRSIIDEIQKKIDVSIPLIYTLDIKERRKLKKDDKLYLTIELTEVIKGKTFKTRIWQQIKNKKMSKLDKVYTNDEAYTIDNIVNQIDAFIENEYKEIEEDIFIFFAVPLCLMSKNINLFKVKNNQEFGKKYRVLYRSGERFKSSKQALKEEYGLKNWKKNWDSFEEKGKRLKNKFLPISSSTKTNIDFMKIRKTPCVVMHYNPSEECFMSLYQSSVPIVIWANNCKKMKRFKKIFSDKIYKNIKLKNLKEEFYLFHSDETDLDANIMLLYDNPNELPPDREAFQKVQKQQMSPPLT